MTRHLTVVIPTHNERDNISALITAVASALEGISWEIIFVDDDSTDGTVDAVREHAYSDDRIRLIVRIGRRGLASACVEGMLASSSPYLAVMDADLQHDETLLPKMFQAITSGEYDIVIGSRYMQGGSSGELAPSRTKISRVANALGRLLLKTNITDPMSGFFLLRSEYIQQNVRKLYGGGFKILMDLLIAGSGQARILELPYVMRSRKFGESKLDALVTLEYLTLILDRLIGRFFPVRFVLFSLVGLFGVAVHLAVLSMTHRSIELPFMWSQTIATVVAMLSNFFLNNIFTYRDRRLHGWGALGGLVTFCMACSMGAIINVALAEFLYERAMAWWLAGAVGALAGGVWNFVLTSTFTWRRTEKA